MAHLGFNEPLQFLMFVGQFFDMSLYRHMNAPLIAD
jgi:hypothetical protein